LGVPSSHFLRAESAGASAAIGPTFLVSRLRHPDDGPASLECRTDRHSSGAARNTDFPSVDENRPRHGSMLGVSLAATLGAENLPQFCQRRCNEKPPHCRAESTTPLLKLR